jgi:hypothetical protein
MANERAVTYHSEFDTEQAEYYWQQAFERYADWGARQKLVELAKLHPCLKEKARISTVTVTRGGRANARSRFKDNASNEQRTLAFGSKLSSTKFDAGYA